MQEVLRNVPELLEIVVLVALFRCLGRGDRSARMKLWLAGWLSIVVHFAIPFSLGVLPRAAVSFISAMMIHVAGLAFLTSLTAFAEDRLQRISFLGLCAVPAAIFMGASYIHVPGRVLYAVCLIAMFASSVLLLVQFERSSRSQVAKYAALTLPFLAWGLYNVVHADSFGGLLAAETALFVSCGFMWWHTFGCFTPGVGITFFGFVSWAAIFPGIALARLYGAGLSIPNHIWNAPKIIVGLGMVVVLLEEESRKVALTAQRYAELFENNLAGVFCSTPEGKIIDCNSAFLSMFGYASREELHRAGALNLYPCAEDRHAFVEQLRGCGQVRNFEAQARRRNGEVFWTLENSSLVHDGSGISLIRGTIFDITERKSLESQLRTAQKMEAVGRLAGGVAHDLNNMLMVISSNTELLAEHTRAMHVHRYTDAIKGGVERAATLIQHLLAFSRKQPLAPRVLNLEQVLTPLRAMLPRLIGSNIHCQLSVPHGTWHIKADPVQIEQIVLNLAANARDAMPNGGQFAVEAGNVVCPSDVIEETDLSAGEYVQIRVSDTGEGMTPEVREHIFDPFFTTKKFGKGTGLGLSTVYGTVRQSGGEIFVTSQPGHGTTFRIYFPRCAGAAAAPTAATTEKPKAAPSAVVGRTILVVDDEDALRHSICEYLGRLGFSVLQARDGLAALEIGREHRVDLLISDLVMPGMSGRDLAAALCVSDPNLQVVYISGYADRVAPEGKMPPNALNKPFSLDTLRSKVEEMLSCELAHSLP